MKIGIIGYGRFGSFIAHKFAAIGHDVVIHDKYKEDFANLNQVCKTDFVLLSVPLKNLQSCLEEIAPKLSSGTVVMDVCSVKSMACDLMRSLLPNNEIIGTHPLFGPLSVAQNLQGNKVVLCNVNAKERTFEIVKNLWGAIGVQTVECSAIYHDEQMAKSQAFVHFVGKIAAEIGVCDTELSTKTFKDLMNIIQIVKAGSQDTFNDMQTLNPSAEKMRKEFIAAAMNVDRQLR